MKLGVCLLGEAGNLTGPAAEDSPSLGLRTVSLCWQEDKDVQTGAAAGLAKALGLESPGGGGSGVEGEERLPCRPLGFTLSHRTEGAGLEGRRQVWS